MTKPIISKSAVVFMGCLMLAGCSVNGGFEDLDQFMAEADRRPGQQVEPIPDFKAYEAFTYSAANRRDPFTPPIQVELAERAEASSDLKPDFERQKELLESFSMTSLRMVGTLRKAQKGPLFALVADDIGGIHRVKEGQFMGKNFGKIIGIDETGIKLIEIVTNGHGGWLERPRTLALEGTE